MEFPCAQAVVIVEDSLFRAYIAVIPQFAEAPEAERQRLLCCDPRFAIEHERAIRPLGAIVLATTVVLFVFKLHRVGSKIDVMLLAHLPTAPFPQCASTRVMNPASKLVILVEALDNDSRESTRPIACAF